MVWSGSTGHGGWIPVKLEARICIEPRQSHLASKGKPNPTTESGHRRFQFGFPPLRLAPLAATEGTQIENQPAPPLIKGNGSWTTRHLLQKNLTRTNPRYTGQAWRVTEE